MPKTMLKKKTMKVLEDDRLEKPQASSTLELADYVKKKEAAAAREDARSARSEKAEKVKSAQIGSSRGIETMFRTSYQTQLDMINLATTKSNIMISLNGVLISMLLISGAYLINSMPMLVVPMSSLLLTCTVAIVFAVLAARPGSRRGQQTIDDVGSDQGALLIFDDFAQFPTDQYVDAMMEMLADHQRVYKNMVAHIHDMGQTANEKFSMLYLSYSIFMAGLVVSVILLLAVVVKTLVFLG